MFIGLLFSSCRWQGDSTDDKMRANQEKLIAEGNRQVGFPAMINYQEKKNLKMIYELRDQEKMICYAYLWNEFNGKLIFVGKCLGYGIPYATQFSNPEKREHDGNYTHEYGYEIPQAEPNGLYMPPAAEGTWLLMLDEAGVSHPVYCEPRVIVSPFKLTIE